jgi:hypothetical protein
MQSRENNMILRLHLRRLQPQDSLRETQSCEKYQRPISNRMGEQFLVF